MPRIKKIILGLTVLVIASTAYYVSATPIKYYFMQDLVMLPIINNGYILQKSSSVIEKNTALQIPDLKQYTHETVLKKVPALKPGKISVQFLAYIKEMEKFSEAHRLKEFSKLQKRDHPRAIVIMSGVFNMEDVFKTINNSRYIEKTADGTYILKIPLLVKPGAGLIIAGTAEAPLILRMSKNNGAILVNAGKLFIVHSDLSGWDEKQNDYARFQSKELFRPFFASWSGSETYFSRSSFRHMGYGTSKSYGITFSIDNDMLKVRPDLPRPKGWIVESLFEEIYYGFYSYEADDIVIIGNSYKDSIVYGIDPHDRSNRLIIAHNETYGTKERHGIIVSREVNDSWIINNRSWGNKGSGIMLDRSSKGNVIAFNESFANGSDGITLFESPNNSIYKNKLYGNKKGGIRLRNSWDVVAWDNDIHDNRIAIEVYASHIQSESRDFKQDPYTHKAGITLIGGEYYNNSGGTFKFKDFDYFRFKGISAFKTNQKPFNADLQPFRKFMPPLIIKNNLHGLEFITTNEKSDARY